MSWSQKITKNSDALSLEPGIFTSKDPKRIAKSIVNSAEKSRRKKGTTLSSSISMINFYQNRAGKNLKPETKRILNKAKDEVRNLIK